MDCRFIEAFKKILLVILLLMPLLGWANKVSEASLKLESSEGSSAVKIQLSEADRSVIKRHSILRLGVTQEGYDPVEKIYGGELRGVAADYLALISASLDLRVEIRVFSDWSAAVNGLLAGEVDVLARGSSYEAGLPGLILSRPYISNQPVVVGRGGVISEPLLDISGPTAVIKGYLDQAEVKRKYPAAQIKLFDSPRDALHSVEYGDSRWFIGDALTVSNQFAIGELSNLKMHPVYDMDAQGYSFVFRVADSSLRDLFNQVLASVPEFQQVGILNHWGVNGGSGIRDKLKFSFAEQQWLLSSPVVKVSVSGSAPPFSFYDSGGNFQGVLADLLGDLGQVSGLRFAIVRQPSLQAMLDSLEMGESDMALMLSSSPEREKFLNFTRPYIDSSFALVVPKTSSIKSLSDLSGAKVSVLKGSIAEKKLKRDYPAIERFEVDNHLDSLVALADRRTDAAVLLLPVARYLVNQYFADDLYVATSLPDLRAVLPFAVGKNNPLLFSVLSKYVSGLNSGFVGGLIARWQGVSPAETSVWERYVLQLRWLSVGIVVILALLLVWFVYSYSRRHRAQAESEVLAFRSALLDGIPQSIAVRDLQGRFVLCNRRVYEIFGVSAQDVTGKKTGEFPGLDAVQSAALERDYFELLTKDTACLKQVDLVVNGESLNLRQWSVPYKDRNGVVNGLIMGWLDITSNVMLLQQLQDARDQAIKANDAKSRFLAVMSHEIRTPLNAIIGLLELVMRRVDRGEGWDRESIEVAYSSSNALLLLIGDILDLAKIESGKLGLDLKRCRLNDVLDSSVRVFDGLARQKGLYLNVERLLSSDYEVLIDAARLKQVLSNLLSNAIKFTDHGGVRVSLQCEKLDAQIKIVFEVVDSGIGMSATDQAQLFEPFTQVGSLNQRGGTGLGLVICRQLVEMMGGVLQLESSKGVGTRVRVSLMAPILKPVEGVGVEVKRESIEDSDGLLRVLLVDDHPANRLLLSQQLYFLGHQVLEAEDGKQALEIFKRRQVDVIITDCHMPVMDGYQLAFEVRAYERDMSMSPSRIIGFTASAQSEERERCLMAGMDDCLFKPVGLDALKKCLCEYRVVHVPPRLGGGSKATVRSFDVSMIESLTDGDTQLMCRLFRELYTSNKIDLKQFEDALNEGRLREQGSLVHRIKGASKMVGASLVVEAILAFEQGLVEVSSDSDLEDFARRILTSIHELQEDLASFSVESQDG